MSDKKDVMEMPVGTPDERIAKAPSIIVAYGGIDGAHHKDWVLDQTVRALTGCIPKEQTATSFRGTPYQYWEQTPGPEYEALVANACAGKDGPNTYSWETGIAP